MLIFTQIDVHLREKFGIENKQNRSNGSKVTGIFVQILDHFSIFFMILSKNITFIADCENLPVCNFYS